MKKKLSAGLFCFMLANISTPVFADAGWTVSSTVTGLVVTYNGGINVRLSPALSNCVPQSGYGPYFAWISPSHPGINRMKADLLAAYVSGKPVALYLGDSTCQVTEMILGGW